MLNDKALAQAGLEKLKTAFARFGSNKQSFPLVYECKLSMKLLLTLTNWVNQLFGVE